MTLPTIKTGIYKHTKTGHTYNVLGVALSTETDEAVVVYEPLWDSDVALFVRPYEMFVEMIEIEGKILRRFEYVGA